MNAVGYARYSTDKQTDNSIAYQFNAITQYCNKNNITLTSFYSDEACSGTNTDRAGFQSMLADAERHKFDAVVIYDISRGSRDVVDWLNFRKEMASLNIKVISCTQELGDIYDPNNFLTELISVGLGQHAVLDTRKKSIAGVATKAKEGIFLGGTPPLGYNIVDGKYIINELEASIVRQIFELYASDNSYDKILVALQGKSTKKGNPFTKSSIKAILSNERYIGVYTWNKKIFKQMRKWAGGKPNPNVVRIEDCIPKIISKEVFNMCQERMNNKERNASYKAKREYLLSGLIECTECGSNYVGYCSTNTKGYTTRYYACGNKYRSKTCHAKNINANNIETFVVQSLKEYLKSANFDEIATQICIMVNNASKDLTQEKKEISEIDTKIKNAMKAFMSGIVFPEMQEEVDRLRVRKNELEDIIARNSKASSPVRKDRIIKLLEYSLEHIDDNPKQAIKALVTKIYANTDGSFTVNVGVDIKSCGGRI
jgi:site-specific DNA recombinase